MGRRQAPPTTDRTRLGAAQRKRLFASAWISNGQNGVEAARKAGYQGKDATLQVRASKLLRDPMVQEMLRAKVEAIENGMKSGEVLDRLTKIARMMDTPIDVFDFVTFLGPEAPPSPSGDVLGQGDGIEAANAQVRAAAACEFQAPPGFAIDLPKAKRLGKGHLVRELSHDAETGAPKVKLESNIALLELSRKALETIARCKGMLRDQPPSPLKPDLTMREVLRMIPLDVLRAYNQAVEEAMARAKAITTTAKRIGG